MQKYYWLVVLNDIVLYISVISITIYRETMMFSITIFVLGQIKMVQQNVRDMEKDGKEIQRFYNVGFDEALLTSVNNCIKKHRQVTK